MTRLGRRPLSAIAHRSSSSKTTGSPWKPERLLGVETRDRDCAKGPEADATTPLRPVPRPTPRPVPPGRDSWWLDDPGEGGCSADQRHPMHVYSLRTGSPRRLWGWPKEVRRRTKSFAARILPRLHPGESRGPGTHAHATPWIPACAGMTETARRRTVPPSTVRAEARSVYEPRLRQRQTRGRELTARRASAGSEVRGTIAWGSCCLQLRLAPRVSATGLRGTG